MEIDRGIEARLPQGDDHALAFAETVDAEKMRAVGIGGDRGDEPAGLAVGALMAEHRQAEGRLGDEEIAAPQLEGRSTSDRAPACSRRRRRRRFPCNASTTWAEPRM